MLALLSNSIKQDNANLSTLSFNEQIPLDSCLGNIGNTKLGKYTDVPLLKASLSNILSFVEGVESYINCE